MGQIVSYIRVSTGKQGKSGLGIEAQREAIARFAAAEGRELLAEFVEIETGKGSDALDRRPDPGSAGGAGAQSPLVASNLRSARLCRPLQRDE
jgi:Resolvase, N terminal domain